MMIQTAKRVIPPFLLDSARQTYTVLRCLPDLPSAYLHPWRRESMARLADLRDKYRGGRAFVIGNGPSLRNTDVSRLKHEYTIGLNRIYLMFPELGFSTSCLVSINDLVIEQCLHDLQSLTIPRFLSWRAHRFFPNATPLAALPTFLYSTYEGAKFSHDVTGRVWEGATVTYVALQLAFHMGFRQVILIGVDHKFASKGAPNATVVSNGDDPNHFSSEYFGKGFRWQLPDLATSERAYALARDAFSNAGREVLDATVGGDLTVFPKADYNLLFK